MKKLFLVMLIYGFTLTYFKDVTASTGGKLIVTHGSSVTVYSLEDRHILWSVDTGVVSANPWVVHEGSNGIVLVNGSEQVAAYDIATGIFLWTHQGSAGATHMTSDVHHQLYNNPILYPHGSPKMAQSSAPVITVSQRNEVSSTTWLVDSRTGEELWSRSDNFETHASQFIPTSSGSYDLIFMSGPKFTGTGGDMFRVDGATGQTRLWSRHFSNRSGIPVPDITGDGQYDFFAEPSYWSSTVLIFDGTTGETVWSTPYGSFDVIQIPQVLARRDGGYDVIVSAQLASAGGIRRYRTENGAVVWDSSHTYNNNTIIGLLERVDGMTILSGWRHQGKAVALDAATGNVLWDNVPLYNSDSGAIGVPDMTGDDNEDVLSISGDFLRLYDGITGAEQTWFTPIESDGVAYVPQQTCSISDDFEDGVIDSSLWIVGGDKGGAFGTCGSGGGQWYNEEIIAEDGYLQARATTPTSANTYGSQAWTRTVYNFNDGKDWLINFKWEADIQGPLPWSASYHLIEITDGRTDWFECLYTHPQSKVLPGTEPLYLSNSVKVSPQTWSIFINHAAATATLYEGPNRSGPVHSTKTLVQHLPWYVRFITTTATSAGFPEKDCRINLYHFSAVCSSVPEPGCTFSDDFESYNPNMWPLPSWIKNANANGDPTNNRVETDPTNSENQVLKLHGRIGGCWAGIALHQCSFPNEFTIECDVYNVSGTLAGCHPYYAQIDMRQGISWANPGRRLLVFGPNNEMIGGTSVLKTYETDRWYHVKICYQREGDNLNIYFWIDGIFEGKVQETIDDLTEELSFDHFELVAQEGTVFFDNVVVSDSLLHLEVVSPNGGEELISGNQYTITWDSLGDIGNVKIELNDGIRWTVIDSNTTNDGAYKWLIPEVTSKECLVRISEVNNRDVYGVSDDVFTIFECLGPIPGDLNNDCYNNGKDLAILTAHWLRCGNPLDSACGIVAYWSFDDPCDPGYDDSGNGYDGTIYGAEPTNGICGNALSFDGVDCYVDTIPQADIPTAITVSMWIYPTYSPESNGQIWGSIEDASGGKDGYVAGYYDDGEYLKFFYYFNNVRSNEVVTSANTVPLDTWSFLTFTVDNSDNVRIYVNSVEKANDSFGFATTSHDRALMIGKAALSQSRAFKGNIDEVRIYNRALTGTEIEYLYNAH